MLSRAADAQIVSYAGDSILGERLLGVSGHLKVIARLVRSMSAG